MKYIYSPNKEVEEGASLRSNKLALFDEQWLSTFK